MKGPYFSCYYSSIDELGLDVRPEPGMWGQKGLLGLFLCKHR